jgi:hypothetical protein
METTIDIKWEVNVNVSRGGTSLLLELPNVTNKMVKKKFGKLPDGLKDKYSESLHITNNIETPIGRKKWCDEKASGIYTLYCSYGVWRIGGFGNNKLVKALEEYLMS